MFSVEMTLYYIWLCSTYEETEAWIVDITSNWQAGFERKQSLYSYLLG